MCGNFCQSDAFNALEIRLLIMNELSSQTIEQCQQGRRQQAEADADRHGNEKLGLKATFQQ